MRCVDLAKGGRRGQLYILHLAIPLDRANHRLQASPNVPVGGRAPLITSHSMIATSPKKAG